MKSIPNIEDACGIIAKLADAGYTSYLVGGFVRDKVRGVPPEDYDIATAARPEDIQKLFKQTIPVGVSFGVVLVVVNGLPYEVATFRSDIGYSDGRHPDSVRFSGPKEDVLRRDFTINGMFYDPGTDCVIDYVGGKEDIEKRLIRTIGDPEERFAEDKLRLLRAPRFAAKLDYKIEPQTANAIRKHAAEITGVSAERIREEISKILIGPHPRRGIELAGDFGLLKHILPEIETMKGVPQPAEFHPEGNVWEHTMLAFDHLPASPEIELAMAALLHDVGKPLTFKEEDRIRFNGHAEIGAELTEKIMRRLRFSKNQQDLVVDLVRQHHKFMEVQNMRPSTLKRFLRTERFDLHLELHRIDCIASHGNLENYEFCRARIEEFSKQAENALHPVLLLSGDDLIEMGLKPGPEFGRILKELEDAQLEGSVVTREDAISLVRRTAGLK